MGKSGIVGKWNVTALVNGEQTITLEELRQAGVQGDMYLEFTKNGNVNLVMPGEKRNGTYVMNEAGTEVTVTISNEDMIGKIEDDKLTFETMVLERE